MQVEVVYAPDALTWVVRAVTLTAGATALDAVREAKLSDDFPTIDFAAGYAVAIFGRAARPATRLTEGDRVEVLRPLAVDPKEARRLRAERKARTGRVV